MIDHMGMTVSDFDASKAFYDKALAPLGIGLVMEIPDNPDGIKGCGFGKDGKPELWIQLAKHLGDKVHLAFAAKTRADVDAFYEAAMAAGGRDNGAPGIRANYHPNYYGAFVLDPDGNNVEAVCHAPEGKGAS